MLIITLIGGKNEKDFEWILNELGIRTVKTVNTGMFGNFSTLTYWLEFSDEDDQIVKRRTFASSIAEHFSNYMVLYEHGNWNRIYIFKKFRIQNIF